MLFHSLDRPARQIQPGVAHLPNWLNASTQAALVTEAREIARSVAGTELAMKRPWVRGGQMSAYILSLGQHWHGRGYVQSLGGQRVPPIPESLVTLARRAVREAAGVATELVPWAGDFDPDVALINYYPPGSAMGMHVDAHEESSAPIVSFSLGDEALFRIGSDEAPRGPWSDLTLLSGDVVVFGGPARRAYHGVVAVREGTGPEFTGLSEGRINITVRQM
ncbi:alpha-ketoglutarate-dependent dioxygenase AlkB family protein [Corynebacterium tapiri]|uniref:Alpha-ketoglutarate-dependent dioxygenase AlkB n=1 Tax=Corynebacterium tapiri TaxID=1448266 RepID=A0A5C4U2K7_9CORY|nr:alpha-ketoglutarate-dependent dioxygenase AlkB [Corynebacterium tapiri]TNL96785.1 alpha-ketoglutarate-dependent dioxygenase AlkB [Corynebacterium tapiri]